MLPPYAYLLAILVSFAGMVVIDRRWRLGVVGRPLVIAIVAVEVAFLLVLDALGSARGWFATNPDLVVGLGPLGIPPEEPLLLAFLTTFAVVVDRIAGRLTGEDPAPDGGSDG
jgi:lycopene cyclase domain-containing protein